MFSSVGYSVWLEDSRKGFRSPHTEPARRPESDNSVGLEARQGLGPWQYLGKTLSVIPSRKGLIEVLFKLGNIDVAAVMVCNYIQMSY